MKNNFVVSRHVESIIVLLLFLMVCILFIPIVDATKYDYPVSYMNQKNEVDIGESACGPTSIAMLLNYYYPSAKITGHDVYHSGTQSYSYHGPAIGYKDVSFAKGDPNLNKVEKEFRGYYSGQYSGIVIGSGSNYLKRYWGGTSNVGSFSDMIKEIKKGPVVLSIRYNNNKKYGHYVLLRGYDDLNTPDKPSDDIFYVNDPYPNWAGHPNGINRKFDYSTILSWFNNGIITYTPLSDKEHRQYTTLVDGSHVQLDDIKAKDNNGKYIWWEYYKSGGDWYYPTTGGHSVTWTPDLGKEGKYEIHVIFYDNTKGEDIKYSVYSAGNPNPIATKSIKTGTNKWRDEILGTFDLKKDSYVRVNSVPKECNVDAVRFEYIGSSTSPNVNPSKTTPEITSITPTQTVAGTFDLTITGKNFDSKTAVDQIYFNGIYVGQGIIKSRSSTKIVVTEKMTGATPGVYVVKVKNNPKGSSIESNGKELTITAPEVPVTLYISPTSGQQGTTFTFSGTGYTPNGVIEWHVKSPDNSEITPSTFKALSTGALSKSYTCSTTDMIGTYTIWAIDKATGRQSRYVTETITAAPVLVSVQYQGHFAYTGWGNWAQDGNTAGTPSSSANQMEAIKIKTSNYGVIYRAHVADVGWQSYVSNGQIAGTVGQGKSLQAIQIQLQNAPSNMHVKYRAYVNGAWQSWVSDGATAGTTGLGLPVKAVQIQIYTT